MLSGITNQYAVLEDAPHQKQEVVSVPSVLAGFQGYNEVKRKKQKEQPMTASVSENYFY